jgi:hypothetical protein
MVVSLQRKVFAGDFGMIFVNKEYLDESGPRISNRIVGADYYLASSNKIWKGHSFIINRHARLHGKDYAREQLVV